MNVRRVTFVSLTLLGVGLLQGCAQDACCDPANKPGNGDNPPCIEGVRCCGDGTWQCNAGDGSSSCAWPGTECSQVCGGIAGIACEDPGSFCKLDVGGCCCDFQGVCVPIPDACIEQFDPVCGCDGETYSNSCFADAAGMSIDHLGACIEP